MEGVNEQIVERLASVDRQIDGLRSEMRDFRTEMSARFTQGDQKFQWSIGVTVTLWVTTILTILFKH